MRASFAALLVAAIAVVLPAPSLGNTVLNQRKTSLRSKVNGTAFQNEIRNAMSEAFYVDQAQIIEVQRVLLPIWQTLPKNTWDRVERRSLRYLAHRYFSKRSALLIRGFEPSRPVSDNSWGSADILSQRLPAYVESVLESNHAVEHGFDLQDAAHMVATLKQIIFDSESSVLDQVYEQQRKPSSRPLSTQGLGQVLESYMVHWLMAGDTKGINQLLANPKLLPKVFPHWDKLVDYSRGEIKSLDYRRQRAPQQSSRKGHNALSLRYDFDDAHEIIGGITTSFASFWESECASMKASLINMDPKSTGRVPLSKFYGSALDKEWRFGESEQYLRDLGALDETHAWRGKQVIIPNYIQGASNCIVSSAHYLVCCINDCESIMGEIEAMVQAPTVVPEDLLGMVGNLTSVSQTTLEEDAPVRGKGSLVTQLQQIAAAHGGRVPLHGRLFAQWLHYAFPRECPFPHKTGIASSAAPGEFGGEYLATEHDMKQHASSVESDVLTSAGSSEETEWMSQWSEEEELVADHAMELAGRGGTRLYFGGGFLLILASLFGVVAFGGKTSTADAFLLPTHGKAHFV